MSIIICLDEIMDAKGISVSKLAREVGISRANMSNLKFGHVRAIRFSTLDRICDVLDCQPGDIFKFEKNESNAPRLQEGSVGDFAFSPSGDVDGGLPAAAEIPIPAPAARKQAGETIGALVGKPKEKRR